MSCIVETCEAPHLARGWCQKHYATWRRHGDPEGKANYRWDELLTLIAAETDECVLWPHSPSHDGYGRVYRDGRQRYVNLLVCAWCHGPNPGGMDAAHSCGVRNCINPRHLSWKTRKHNMDDQLAHDTRLSGERHPRAKLTAAQVATIRKRGKPRKALAEEYGVSISAIQHIQNGRSWSKP